MDLESLYNNLKDIVGSEYITRNEVIMEAYTASYAGTAPVHALDFKPAKPHFVVRVGSKEEVQSIVRLANKYKVPIIPMGALTSMYGEAVPLEGGIILVFDRMDRIEIDEETMTVSFEPGVTYAQAYRELTKRGYYIPFQSLPANVSVLGTTTQAGMHMPYSLYVSHPYKSYHCDLTIGVEVVLPTGELLVTGSAALPGVKQIIARAYGPDLARVFLGAQGTLGVIVKQTLPLYYIPEARHVVTGIFKIENFEGLTNAMQRMVDDMWKEYFWWAEKVWGDYNPEGRCWNFYVVLAGSEKKVKLYRDFSENIIKEEGGTILEGSSPMLEPESGYSGSPMGLANEEAIFWRPRANAIRIPPVDVGTLTIEGEGTYTQLPDLYNAALKLLSEHGFEDKIKQGGVTPVYGWVHPIFALLITYNLSDEEARKAAFVRKEWERISSELTGIKRLPLLYRPTPTLAKELMPKLGEYYILLKKLKQLLDPNNIMNPGKLAL